VDGDAHRALRGRSGELDFQVEPRPGKNLGAVERIDGLCGRDVRGEGAQRDAQTKYGQSVHETPRFPVVRGRSSARTRQRDDRLRLVNRRSWRAFNRERTWRKPAVYPVGPSMTVMSRSRTISNVESDIVALRAAAERAGT